MYPQDFLDWWATYPRRVGKRKAWLLWQQALKAIGIDRGCDQGEAKAWLLERTKQFAKSPKGQSNEFCPYPSTWLFQGRYDDDIDEWKVAGGMRKVLPPASTPEDIEREARHWRP